MNAQDAMRRLCRLQAEVAEHIGSEHASDCFCGHGGYWSSRGYDGTEEGGYRNDGVHIQFIEDAVREKIEREKEEK